MLDYFEPGGSLSWRGPTQSYLYRIFTNEQEELLLKQKGYPPTPLEVIEVGTGSQMGLLSHGQGAKLCRNLICIEPAGFPTGATFTAPDFAAGALRPLYVLGQKERQVEGLGLRKVLSVVLGDEEEVGYDFDLASGLLVWTNNWQVEAGQPRTCEVELEEVTMTLSRLDYQTRPLQYQQQDRSHRLQISQPPGGVPSPQAGDSIWEPSELTVAEEDEGDSLTGAPLPAMALLRSLEAQGREVLSPKNPQDLVASRSGSDSLACKPQKISLVRPREVEHTYPDEVQVAKGFDSPTPEEAEEDSHEKAPPTTQQIASRAFPWRHRG